MRRHSIGFLIYLTVIYFILVFTLPGRAAAEKPLDTVKGYAEKVLDVLRDPALKGESAKKVRKERIRAISKKMFDFNELSKRTLSNHWRKLNPEQQQEFVRLYTSLLEDAYADKILSYTNEKITFSREVMLSDRMAEVQSIVQRRTAEIPIYYR